MWVVLAILGGIASQTDWMGGAGVLGPVQNWGTQYWVSDSVTVATAGQASLVATGWNYANWVKHIVESNAGIQGFAQGFMPADINNDGIVDLVAHTNDSVVWYKHDGYYNFSKNVIGPADDGGYPTPCVYPCDLDQDGDIDVLVATSGVGAGWYENQSASWVWHSLDGSTGYHRISAVDVELDGYIDIIAVDNSGVHSYKMCGDIYLFRNQSMLFIKELVANLPTYQGWRVYPVDFNADGYPDIYSVFYQTYIFKNDGTGHFTQTWYQQFWATADFDGAWPSDVDMDGDMDLVVCGQYNSPYAFYGLLGDGTGINFNLQLLSGTSGYADDYGDGGISCDIDLDGYSDIAGTNYRVGYFRRDPLNPLTFTLYDIEALPARSHWVYAYPTSNVCIPAVDLLVTYGGAHVIYENRMLLGFANIGYLESSILELTAPHLSACDLKYFGYNACVSNDTSLCFYWRSGLDSANIVNNPWNGPYYATIGMNVVDSFALSGTGRMFQYKAEFRRAPDDIAVLYEVWLTYNCLPVGVDETPVDEIHEPSLQFANGRLVLFLPHEDWVGLTVYDVSGRLLKDVFKGRLPSGEHEFGAPERQGIYFAKLRYTEGSKTLKFIKLK